MISVTAYVLPMLYMPHRSNADPREKIPNQKQQASNRFGLATTRLRFGRRHFEQPW